jgi:hypothetical protein
MSGGSALALDWSVVMVPHRAARRADPGRLPQDEVFLNAIKEAPHPANSPTSSRDEVSLMPSTKRLILRRRVAPSRRTVL